MENFVAYFSEQLVSGNLSPVILFLAFLGGVLMSLAPCNLAILPLIIGYVAGSGERNKKRLALQLLMFVLGLGLVFSIIGVIAALTGQLFISILSPYWLIFIASIILVFGLSMVGLFEFNFPVLVKQFPDTFKNHTYLYAFIVGMVFALAATPCSTPILAGIMAATTLSKNALMGALMLFAFSLGQSLIIVLAGLFTSFLANVRKLSSSTNYITIIAGWIFIIFAALLYYKVFAPFFN